MWIGKIKKRADVCPQCGSNLALNGPVNTECPNPNCPNYSVLQDQRVRTDNNISPSPPAGTLEYNRDFIPDIVEISVTGRMWNIHEVGLPDPVKYELSTLIGQRIYIVQIPLPFKHIMIPTQYKSNASSLLSRINLNGSDVFVTQNDECTYYMRDASVLSKFLEGLNALFGKPEYKSSDELQQLYKPTPDEPNDLARHPIAPPLADKLP